jgi:uncharacterized coiled-coil DUF342 family protein
MAHPVSPILKACRNPHCAELIAALVDEITNYRPRMSALLRELARARGLIGFYKAQAAWQTASTIYLQELVDDLQGQLNDIRQTLGLTKKQKVTAAVRRLHHDLEAYADLDVRRTRLDAA